MSNLIPPTADNLETLEQDWQLREYQFHSDAPVVGWLIGRFRAAWNNIASRWAVGHAMAQQNYVNQMVRQQLQYQTEWLVAQERENSDLRRQIGELEGQLKRLMDGREGPTGA